MVYTSPDISYSVGMLSRYICNPSRYHFGVAKRILRYVAGVVDFGIWYECASNFRLFGYFNSDWAGSTEDRRNTYGSVFLLGSGAVTWSFKKQQLTTLSTTEVEYDIVTSSACQAI